MKQQAVINSGANRIEWIDAAKALAIVLMIIGHTVEFGTFTRNLIFSFHMPVFVLLSGFTFKIRNDKTAIIPAMKNDIKRLLGPVALTFFIELILRYITSGVYTMEALVEMLKVRFTAIFWASGIAVYESAALGSIWFLISLFWLRILARVITSFLSFSFSMLVMYGLSVIGVCISKVYFLPQNFDVVLTMLFFFATGMLWKKYEVQIQKYEVIISAIFMCILSISLYKGVYIELASRSYPHGFLCFAEAIAGSFLCVQVAKILSKSSIINTGLQFIGTETLLILCIHYLDKFFKPFWVREDVVLSCVLRMIFDLGVFAFIMIVKSLWKKWFVKKV